MINITVQHLFCLEHTGIVDEGNLESFRHLQNRRDPHQARLGSWVE